MIDKRKIGEWFDKRGLWGKPFNQFTEDEIDGLINAVLNAPNHTVPANGWKPPYINGAGELIISGDSHPRYHWWANGQSIHDTLKELGASQEIIDRHISTLGGVPF